MINDKDMNSEQATRETVRKEYESIAALVGCIAGAALVDDTWEMAKDAGLSDIKLERKTEYIESMAERKDPFYREIMELLPAGTKLDDYVTSLNNCRAQDTPEEIAKQNR